MKHIEQIRSLMKQSKSIPEFTNALRNADIPAWGTIKVDESFKKEHGIMCMRNGTDFLLKLIPHQ
jgi:hypothetical protein